MAVSMHYCGIYICTCVIMCICICIHDITHAYIHILYIYISFIVDHHYSTRDWESESVLETDQKFIGHPETQSNTGGLWSYNQPEIGTK